MTFDFSKFVESILVPLNYSASEIEFLKNLRHAAGKYTDFAKILEKNKEIELHFLKAFSDSHQSQLKDPVTSSAVALSMLGFIPSRNFLSASMLKGKNKLIIPGDSSVEKSIRFAMEAESQGGEFATEYFIAGLIFDQIQAILPETWPKNLLEKSWKHGVQVSKIALQLLKGLCPTPGLEKDLCLDGLVHDAGKIGLYEEGQTPRPPELPDQTCQIEEKEGGLPHSTLSYLILDRIGFLPESSWVVFYHHEPFLAARMGNIIHLRTHLIWLANLLIRYREFHRSNRFPARMIHNWFEVSAPLIKGCTQKKFEETIQGMTF